MTEGVEGIADALQLSSAAPVVISELMKTSYQREEKACAAAISATEAGSRGDFNTLYGGTTWTGSLDAFPDWAGVLFIDDNGVQSITHAYGAFQFEPATWRMIAGLTGRSDVRPPSQILNALYLAYKDFKRRSGTDLLVTLKSGALDQISRYLVQTWPGGCDTGFPARYTAALKLFPEIVVPPPPTPDVPPIVLPSDMVEVTITAKMKLSDLAKILAQK